MGLNDPLYREQLGILVAKKTESGPDGVALS